VFSPSLLLLSTFLPRRITLTGGRSKKERGKFIGEVHLQSKGPSWNRYIKKMIKEK
jgi:hypothetical protein